jgi:hypothetical protein
MLARCVFIEKEESDSDMVCNKILVKKRCIKIFLARKLIEMKSLGRTSHR